MRRTRNKAAALARRIAALRRAIDGSLMELTEVEVLINARLRMQAEGGELERTRRVLTNAITKMDAELEQLQRRMAQVERPLVSSDEIRFTLGT